MLVGKIKSEGVCQNDVIQSECNDTQPLVTSSHLFPYFFHGLSPHSKAKANYLSGNPRKIGN